MKRLLLALLTLVLYSQATATNYDIPTEVREKYAAIYQLQPELLSDGSIALGKGRRYFRRGIHVLYLEGDRFEMGYQHGRLMRDEIAVGALPGAAAALGNTILSELGRPLVASIASKLLYRTITDKMFENGIKNQPSNAGDPLLDGYGLSEGSGLSFKTIVHAALGPESLTVLLGNNLNGHTFSNGGVSPNECSSFVVWGNATSNGDLLIGRNTDYPLNGSYDRFPTVLYFNPTDGTQKYMAVTSAGLHNAGVVGMNESGVWLDVHTIPTLDVSPEGMPVFMIAQEVLRNAKNLDDALRIFKTHHPAAGWAYLVVSTGEKRAATVELTHSQTGVRMEDGDTLIQTNHLLTPEMQARYAAVNPATDGDTRARYRRVQSLLDSQRGKLDERGVAAILGDKFDIDKNEPAWLNGSIAVHTTMTSAIVHPALSKIYVANGTAPVSQNEYIELPLVTLDPSAFAKTPYDFFANDQYKRANPEKAEAEQLFIKAKVAFENEIDLQKSIGLLNQTLQKDSSVPGAYFILGILHLKLKEWENAISVFNGLTLSSDMHYSLLAHYYLAKTLATRGDTSKAVTEAEYILNHADPAKESLLIAAAGSLFEKIQSGGRVKFKILDLPLMFQEADMISYK